LGLPVLHYYENEGLVVPERSKFNRRSYSEEDIMWVDLMKRLQATGMPLSSIKEYAQLRSKGDSTLSERLEILVEHRQALNEQIAQLLENQVKLDEKIASLKQEVEHQQRSAPQSRD